MMTFFEIFHYAQQLLKKKNIEDYYFCAKEIIAFVTQKSWHELLQKDNIITEEEKKKIDALLCLRAEEKRPLAYILGYTYFFDMKIKVNQDVLIPRSETEQLVEQIIMRLQKVDLEKKVLWDIGCGSGCIGLAIKKYFPKLQVTLSDISEKALQVAKENAKEQHLEVNFKQGDLFTPFLGEKADFIVSNPPYVAMAEYDKLSRDVKDYEPKLALIAEDNGIAFYKKFFQQLPQFLQRRGKAFFEIGYQQKRAVQQIFSQDKIFSLFFEKDLSCKDRFFFLEIE